MWVKTLHTSQCQVQLQSLQLSILSPCEWQIIQLVPPALPYRKEYITGVEKPITVFCLLSFHEFLYLFLLLQLNLQFTMAVYNQTLQKNKGGERPSFPFYLHHRIFEDTEHGLAHSNSSWALWVARQIFETEHPNIIGRTYDILAADRTTSHEKSGAQSFLGCPASPITVPDLSGRLRSQPEDVQAHRLPGGIYLSAAHNQLCIFSAQTSYQIIARVELQGYTEMSQDRHSREPGIGHLRGGLPWHPGQ